LDFGFIFLAEWLKPLLGLLILHPDLKVGAIVKQKLLININGPHLQMGVTEKSTKLGFSPKLKIRTFYIIL
jgi:hypothetical protein